MVSSFISRLVILVFGTLYPAYASYKAVRTKNVKEYVKWMMYWIVFALFTCAETFTDLFLSFWFPFYYEIKIITVIYLLSPATKGSSILYRKFVHPVLIAREQEIDEYIAKAKEQGYHTMLNLGSKGVTYATSLIMQTAIKGGNGLVSQLKKSYSLSDLSEEKNRRQEGSEVDGGVRHRDDPRLVQRMPDQRRVSGTNQEGLYFPEVDTIQRPIVPEDEHYYSRIPSYEEISSGYSSGDPMFTGAYSSRDPFYNDAKRTKGDALVRTGSLGGGSTRVRTKASGLPKRSSLSEGESTWAAMEPRESQNEPHNRFYGYPLTQSASLPFSFSTFHNLMRPEYQHIFGNIPPQQMFASVNNPPVFSYHIPENISDEVSGSNTTHGVCNTPGVVISEVESDGVNNLKDECNTSARGSVSDKSIDDNEENVEIKQGTNNTKSVSEFQVNKDDGREDKTLETGDKKSENDDNKTLEMTCEREHSPKERSGKYNKKPAPVPPNDDINAKRLSVTTLEDEEELEFVTPNASPKLEKKFSHSSASIAEGKCSTAGEVKAEGKKETQPVEKTKNKSKTKKGDNISKKLHLPKMPFSFWHQKGGKHSSGSETSSVASADVASMKSEDKNDLEIFIPLKDDVNDKNDNSEVIEEPKFPHMQLYLESREAEPRRSEHFEEISFSSDI